MAESKKRSKQRQKEKKKAKKNAKKKLLVFSPKNISIFLFYRTEDDVIAQEMLEDDKSNSKDEENDENKVFWKMYCCKTDALLFSQLKKSRYQY